MKKKKDLEAITNLEEVAKKMWNKEADKYNQWDNLDSEEKNKLIKFCKVNKKG